MSLVPRYVSDRVALWEVPSEGPPAPDVFLLVHGLGQDRATFTSGPLPAALARRGRVLLAELDGPSRQSTSRPTRGLAEYLQTVLPVALAEAHGIGAVERVHYVGHSMGGYLGLALAASRAPIDSLSLFAAPLPIALGRPQIVLAAALARLLLPAFGARAFPLQHVLRVASSLATAPRSSVLRIAHDLVRLGDPDEAPRDVLLALLRSGSPESARVLLDFCKMAVTGEQKLANLDLLETLRSWDRPIFTAIGDEDVFGHAATLRRAAAGTGARKTVLVKGSAHSDLVIGRRARTLAHELLRFLEQAGALAPRKPA
ncbi:MAG: alpha/beta fold hydrolase [Deltaproteobacteria bacterium]|nr:alpha/beta fold hydrolase [Deltaproteobacteria bacterium]